MTHAERRSVEAAASHLGVQLHWRAGDRPRFTKLVARPCPFYEAKDSTCRIYESRPYNCRRFMCGRDDLSEPFDAGALDGIPARVWTSDALRAQYAQNQTDAQVWADARGWVKP
jgi:Fe-S-cluster containining protein